MWRYAGLAIYAARGLRSGTAEIIAVAFIACGGWQLFSKKEVQKSGIVLVSKSPKPGRNRGAEEERKHAETQAARAERRNLVKHTAFYAAIPKEKSLAEKKCSKKR